MGAGEGGGRLQVHKAGAQALILPMWLPKLQVAVSDSPFARLGVCHTVTLTATLLASSLHSSISLTFLPQTCYL